MKFPNAVKIIWWLLLLSTTSYYLFMRLNYLLEGKSNSFDIIVFVFWICFLISPLYKEVELFGIKLKQELGEVKQELSSLRNDIQNSISVNNQNSSNFYLNLPPSPPSDASLPALEQRLTRLLDEVQNNLGIHGNRDYPLVTAAPDEISYLFSVRYNIERELRRIWRQRFKDQDISRNVSILQITNLLVKSELIDNRLASVIREVYSICSPAIHGEDVTSNQVSFVRDIAPGLIATLRAII